jgi:tetratricopeptide (TPR) repeat protein
MGIFLNIRSRKWILIFACVSAGLTYAEDVSPEALVKLLGSDHYKQREEAQQQLLAIGVKAKAALQQAISSEQDTEVLMRAKYVLNAVVFDELKGKILKSTAPAYEAEALEMCKIIVKNLDDADFLMREGTFRFITPDRVEMFIQQMKQVLKEDPKNTTVAYILGCAFYWQENYDDAIAAWLYVEHFDRQHVRAIIARGQAFMNQEKYGEAKTAFEAAKKIDPTLADPIWYLALLSAKIGDHKKAFEIWKTSQGLNGSRESCLTYSIGLGRLYIDAGDLEEAKNAKKNAFKEIDSIYAKSLSSDYYTLLIYREFAKAYEAAGLIDDVDQNLADAKSKIPEVPAGVHPDILLMEANAQMLHGEHQKAVELIKQVMRLRGETESLRKLMLKATTGAAGTSRPRENNENQKDQN